MKASIFFLLTFAFAACKSTKNNTPAPTTVTPKKDTVISKPVVKTFPENSLPACVAKLVATMKAAPVTNPPSKIYSFTYQNKTVYYVPAVCCDMFSDLYDSNCNMMGHPDGGFTGRGDGKFKDFDANKTNEKLLWADGRK